MSGWEDGRYSTSRRQLDGGLKLSVVYQGGADNEAPWEAYVWDRRLKGGFVSEKQAQAAAERIARRLLQRALADLGPAPPTPTSDGGETSE